MATDLFPGREDIGQHDFLHGPLPSWALGAIALTNPPYTLLTEFLGADDRLWDPPILRCRLS